jgi:SAM-dependent methyltransferase
MSYQSSSGKEGRSRIADSYTRLTDQGYFTEKIGGNERYIGNLMDTYVPDSTHSMLEVGGATGLWAADLLRKRQAIKKVTAVEFSAAAVAYQERLAPILSERGGYVDVLQADFQEVADQLPSAEVVASSFVAQYMGDPSQYLARLFELVEPGGRVIFADILSHQEGGESISTKAALESFALVCLAYLEQGQIPPLVGLARSGGLYKLYQEPSFLELQAEYHDHYYFPLKAWKAEQQKYPGAKFHNLGVAGLLMLPKVA